MRIPDWLLSPFQRSEEYAKALVAFFEPMSPERLARARRRARLTHATPERRRARRIARRSRAINARSGRHPKSGRC